MQGQHFHTSDHFIDPAEATPAELAPRGQDRVPYTGHVVLVLITAEGDRTQPIVADAREISVDEISIVSRQMLHPGAAGAMQMMRSDGRLALVGVEVRGSTYIGNMQHITACRFVPLPATMPVDEFLDEDGRLKLLDPCLMENRASAGG